MTKEEAIKKIEQEEVWILKNAYNSHNLDIMFHSIKGIINELSEELSKETLQELRAEIDREGDYYDTNVDQDIAKGLYKAVQIIDRKISEVSE